MIDTHCHLTMMDAKKAVDEARREGLKAIVTVGVDWEDSLKVKELSERFSEVYGVVGIHPHESKRYAPPDVDRFFGLLGGRVVAIGEVGLDFYKNYSPRERQVPLFEAFAAACAKRKVPIVVHTRAAESETYAVLSQWKGGLKGVIHCFSGGREFAKKVLDMGFYISLAGNITYKGDKAREILSYIPLDALLLETDAPFLAPVPVRGRKNKPSYIKHTYEFVASVLSMDVEELKKRVYENARSAFGF